MRIKILLANFFLLLTVVGSAQDTIRSEKLKEAELIIPVRISLRRLESELLYIRGKLIKDSSDVQPGPIDQDRNVFLVSEKASTYRDRDSLRASFYIIVGKDVSVPDILNMRLEIQAGPRILNKEICVTNNYNIPYLLDDYSNNKELILDNVGAVKSENNVLTLYGFKNNINLIRKVQLKQKQVYAIKSYTGSFYIPKVSLITVPFKIRPETKTFKSTVTSGLTNVGLNFDFFGWERDRYFANSTKSNHKFSFGFWVAPSIEEIDSVYAAGANGALGKGVGKMEKSKQMFASTGITISYSYNDISFVLVPIGWDLATTAIGKQWVYNGKRWWGFGIGISPKIFSTILNK